MRRPLFIGGDNVGRKYEHAGGYAGKNLHFAEDDGYNNLIVAIIFSGIISHDVDFLRSDWCAHLLDSIGCELSGPELLAVYDLRKGDEKGGKR